MTATVFMLLCAIARNWTVQVYRIVVVCENHWHIQWWLLWTLVVSNLHIIFVTMLRSTYGKITYAYRKYVIGKITYVSYAPCCSVLPHHHIAAAWLCSWLHRQLSTVLNFWYRDTVLKNFWCMTPHVMTFVNWRCELNLRSAHNTVGETNWNRGWGLYTRISRAFSADTCNFVSQISVHHKHELAQRAYQLKEPNTMST